MSDYINHEKPEILNSMPNHILVLIFEDNSESIFTKTPEIRPVFRVLGMPKYVLETTLLL